VYENGIIQDIKEGIVIVKTNEAMAFEAVNVLPLDQLLLSAIAFHSLFNEYVSEGTGGDDGSPMDIDDGLDGLLYEFIKVLLAMKDKTTNNKGDVLQ
jgi:hypothetical protein